MTGEQSPVAGHPSACRTVLGNICVYVKDMKELFRFILREPVVPGLLRWELRLMSAYSHLLHSVIQELKGCFPLLKWCRASGGHRPLGNSGTHCKRERWAFWFPHKGATHTVECKIETGSLCRTRWQKRLPLPERWCITEQQWVFRISL